jgi:hypothetical protein
LALGDGIRRNLATVSQEERDRLRDAIIKLHTQKHYPGARSDNPVGGVSFWFKQDEIHAHTHVHGVPAFVPWHRELINRFEALIREVDPELSLHYWDWTQDPQNIPDGEGGIINFFTSAFLGGASGEAGDPWLTAGFYVPGATPFRSNNEFDPNNNPFDPPRDLTRSVNPGAPVTDDSAALGAGTYKQFHDEIKISHDDAHGHIGGTLGDAHTSFRDVVAFVLHSNLDRIWAMWQRDPAHPQRLDPAHVYDYAPNEWGVGVDPERGSGDVASGDPFWGFSSPLEPWASPGAQTGATGIVANVQATRPWAPPENEQVTKDCRHPSVVMPPSYDTVPHSSYMIFDRDTFSSVDVAVLATVDDAFSIVYDGFMPKELGQPIVAPNVTLTLNDASGPAAAGITTAVGAAQLEDSAPDMPQRILFPVSVTFTDPATAFGFGTETQVVHARATHGGWATDGALELIKQPNPYMHDGPVSWLSTDVRVFKTHPNDTVGGVTQPDPTTDSNAPLTFIQALLNHFNSLPNDANHPFLQLSTDEQASELQLSRTEGNVPVFNYAVAKVRYVAQTTAADQVQMFFRVFSTLLSALDYNTQTNYRRGGTWPNGAPRLGLIDGEVASIPFFASGRTSDTQSMDLQPDPPNKQDIAATGQETAQYFGCWLDFNQPNPRFPQFPTNEGPYTANTLPIPQLVRGHHSCLVAEIFFQPGGGADPIAAGATPASSDRLAQRNLAIADSGNPDTATHIVEHTFMIHPSSIATDEFAVLARAPPDELMFAWGNLPRDATATLHVPEWDTDEVLRLATLRQLPNPLTRIDAHTLGLPISDVGFVPIPGGAQKDFASLLTITLPSGIREKQVFRVDVRQLSHARRRFRGGFRVTIPVLRHEALLPREVRRLAVLRYIAAAIPPGDRWQAVFTRYVDGAAAKVRALGHDPDQVPPSLDDPAGGRKRRRGWLWWLVHLLRRLLRWLRSLLP